GVAVADARFDDAGVAAGPLFVALGERRQHLVGELRVLQRGDQLAARLEAAALAQRDEALNHRPEVLRLGQGGGNRLMLQTGMAEVVEHGLAMSRGAAEAAAA